MPSCSCRQVIHLPCLPLKADAPNFVAEQLFFAMIYPRLYRQLAGMLALFLLALGTLPAQEWPQQQALVVKKTATWCSNCGSWGWNWFKDLQSATAGEPVIALNLHSTSSTLKPPMDLDGSWLGQFSTTGGFPTFYVNGQHYGSYPALLQAARDASTTDPLAGITLETGYDQGVILARGQVTWLTEGAGQYHLGFYIVEDSLVHPQTGQGNNALHRNVLRRAFDNAPFGEAQTLAHVSGTGLTWTAEAAYTLPSVERHRVLAVLWRLDGTQFRYVNAAMVPLAQGLLSSQTPAQPAPLAFQVYPNPLRRGEALQLEGRDDWSSGIWSLCDQAGKRVWQEEARGQRQLLLSPALPAGSYVLSLYADGQRLFSRPLMLVD